MTPRPLKTGRLTYTARAFEQDANQAMRGDIVRALIELITNADDAYGDKSGEILIEIRVSGDEELPRTVHVRDMAVGLSAKELEHHFTTLGAMKADSASRGLLGRGAKDVASLGRLSVETIKEGKYSALELDMTGEFRLVAADDEPPSDARERMCLDGGQSGLSASIHVRPQIRLPGATVLERSLSRHAQLRDLLGRRRVSLIDHRQVAKTWSGQLRPPAETGHFILDEQVQVAGYEVVRLRVRRLEHADQEAVSPWSEQGLLIRSGRTTFENTWLEVDRRHPEAALFAGEVIAPQIAALIRAFDSEGSTAANPTRLLSRDREGLVREHPYRKALQDAIRDRLGPIFEAASKEARAQQHEGEQLKRDLKAAAHALKEELSKALEELEEESRIDDVEGEGIPPLAIIPPRIRLRTGERATLSLRALRRPDHPPVASVTSQSAEGVVLAVDCSTDGWSPHPRLEAVSSTMYVSAGPIEGTAVIDVVVGQLSSSLAVVVDDTDQAVDPPAQLEFFPNRVTASPSRGRVLTIRAPIEFESVHLALEASANLVSLEQTECVLKSELNGRWCEASVRAHTGLQTGTCQITARTADMDATCTLTVRNPTSATGVDMDFKLSGLEVARRSARALQGVGILVTVYASHPSFNGVFGTFSQAQQRFEQEDSPVARAVLAEVIADEISSYLTELGYQRRPELLNDASRILRQRAQYSLRFLSILHRALRSGDHAG